VHVLKAAHHGSRTSSTAEFLGLVRPRWVVIQAGRGNRYGHPHGDVVRRYEGLGARVWDGRVCGEVRVWVEGEAMRLDSAGGCGGR
jgi:competence protein ComEC